MINVHMEANRHTGMFHAIYNICVVITVLFYYTAKQNYQLQSFGIIHYYYYHLQMSRLW